MPIINQNIMIFLSSHCDAMQIEFCVAMMKLQLLLLRRCTAMTFQGCKSRPMSSKIHNAEKPFTEENTTSPGESATEVAHPDYFPPGFFQNLAKATTGVVEKSEVIEKRTASQTMKSSGQGVTLSPLESRAPPGKLTVESLRLLYGGVRKEPESWTPERVAAEFGLPLDQSVNMLKYFRTARKVTDRDGDMFHIW